MFAHAAQQRCKAKAAAEGWPSYALLQRQAAFFEQLLEYRKQSRVPVQAIIFLPGEIKDEHGVPFIERFHKECSACVQSDQPTPIAASSLPLLARCSCLTDAIDLSRLCVPCARATTPAAKLAARLPACKAIKPQRKLSIGYAFSRHSPHAPREMRDPKKVLDAFRHLTYDVLVVEDMATRGLDQPLCKFSLDLAK